MLAHFVPDGKPKSTASDIFGEVWKSYAGTSDKYGVMLGSESIQQRGTTYNYTLAYRLGNCASSPKTLTITVGGTTESATLDKDFKTNRTTYTDAAIVNYINSQLSNCQVVLAASNADFNEIEPWDDCKEMVVNADTRTMMYGMAVRRRAGNQWVICDSGYVPQGVVCERINPNGYGKVAILDKNIFTDLYGVNATVGQRIIPADGGAWTVNSNGLLKAVSNNAYQIG